MLSETTNNIKINPSIIDIDIKTLATQANMTKYAQASSDFGRAIASSECLIPTLVQPIKTFEVKISMLRAKTKSFFFLFPDPIFIV